MPITQEFVMSLLVGWVIGGATTENLSWRQNGAQCSEQRHASLVQREVAVAKNA